MVFISLCGCKLLCNVLSFQPEGQISCWAGQLEMTLLRFCLSGNVLISPSFLKNGLARLEMLVDSLFFP